jgi:hypothetical protein
MWMAVITAVVCLGRVETSSRLCAERVILPPNGARWEQKAFNQHTITWYFVI